MRLKAGREIAGIQKIVDGESIFPEVSVQLIIITAHPTPTHSSSNVNEKET